jgi:hypothetical protein
MTVSIADADQSAVQIAARYSIRTAHIQSIGTLYDNTTEIGAGSGILIGDKMVLTNNHLIPSQENYKTLLINVRLKSRTLNPLAVSQIHRDQANDLALLELSTSVADAGGTTRCPMPVIDNPDEAPMGTQLYVLGFPLDQDLSISSGLVSNQTGANGRWQTDSVMNAGNSGGPVFNEFGAFMGLAVGGIVRWKFDGGEVPVNGVNFIIPSTLILNSPIYDLIQAIPANEGCWTNWRNTVIHASNLDKINDGRPQILGPLSKQAKIPDIVVSQIGKGTNSWLPDSRTKPLITDVPVNQLIPPNTLNRVYSFSETKDDHPIALATSSSNFSKEYPAEPGYRITGCSWHTESANHADNPVCNVIEGGAKATFTVRLTSGPTVDRWRGWWGGTVSLSQSRN